MDDQSISAEEACANAALTAEDFARLCNDDGTTKTSQQTSTTEPVEKATAMSDATVFIGISLVVIVVIGGVLLWRRLRDQT